MPFKWYPGARVLTQAFLWRMLDLEGADGRRIDVVVEQFPSYVVHRRRVWLVHQFRQAYELDGTDLGQFEWPSPDACAPPQVQGSTGSPLRRRRAIRDLRERRRTARARPAFFEVLPRPPQALPYRTAPSEGFVLSASRLDRAKRIDLLLGAAAATPGFDVVVASDGPDRERLESVAHDSGLDGRVRFEGRVSGRLAELYARARRSSTRPWTRTSAWGRTRRSSRASP